MDQVEDIEKTQIEQVKNSFRMVPNYPKEGINFIDITPLLKEPSLSEFVLEFFEKKLNSIEFDAILGVESRGFIFGMALAQRIKKPFVLVRKAGKLPAATISEEYSLEYGVAKIEIHKDALKKGQKVIIHDDLLATGGTALAAANLAQKLEATVTSFLFVIELCQLNGAEKLQKVAPVISMTKY